MTHKSTSKPKGQATVPLRVLDAGDGSGPTIRTSIKASRMGPRRAAVLILVHVLIIAHIIQWRLTGRTISPVEPSESMFTLEQGLVNAGFIFFSLAILSTLIFGRFFCGWACHVVALQDLCGWIMKKCGVRPKPFRSRLLIYFPLMLALYMFVWPTVKRVAIVPALRSLEWNSALAVIGAPPAFPGFQNHLITEDFWATFPSVWVAIPFFLVCGFATVYFLGAKGFCTYGCPYGGFFAPMDKVAPGRIIVDHDKCHQCGHCTAVCTSNVRVHEEIREYGMVVDPGCMKCMDCVSVCPNDALSFGFAKPAVAKGPPKNEPPKRKYDMTWGEEFAMTALLIIAFFAWRSIYGVVPMLMAAGVAGVIVFLTWKAWRVFRDRDVRIIGAQLKRAGSIKPAGVVFLAVSTLALLLTAHSLVIRYHWWMGDFTDAKVLVAREQAMNPDPNAVPDAMRETAAEGLAHYQKARSMRRGGWGLSDTPRVEERAAWLELVSGDRGGAIETLRRLDERYGYADARSMDVATILATDGMEQKALAYLERVLEARPQFTLSRNLLISARLARGETEEAIRVRRGAIDPTDHNTQRQANAYAQLGGLLLQLNRAAEALPELETAVSLDPDSPSIRNDYAVALFLTGSTDRAVEEMRASADLSPDDPLVRIRLGQMLTQLGRNAEAQAAFEEARTIDPEIFENAS